MSKGESAMQGSTTDRTSTGYVAMHQLDPDDAAIIAAMRALVSSSKGARPGNRSPRTVIEKYTGVLAAADVFTHSTTVWVMESIRLDSGFASYVHP